MPRMRDLHAKLQSQVDFLLVYTLEAHADNEWPINNAQFTHDGEPVHVKQPRSMLARRKLASDFVRDYDVPFTTLVDDLNNSFEANFASWPTRYYIIHNSKLFYKAQPEGGDSTEFFIETLESALDECLAQIDVSKSRLAGGGCVML